MRIRETCGCGASIDIDGSEADLRAEIVSFRVSHRHDSRPPASTESDERGHSGVMPLERDPASTVASVEERADVFGFGYGEGEVTV